MSKTDTNDPTMTPGHPQCNYEKFMAAQKKVTVVCQGDQRNPQYKSLRLSFNGQHSIEVPYDRPHPVPRPYAEMILMGAKGTVVDDPELVASLASQVGHPITGPIPGPLSGAYVDEMPA